MSVKNSLHLETLLGNDSTKQTLGKVTNPIVMPRQHTPASPVMTEKEVERISLVYSPLPPVKPILVEKFVSLDGEIKSLGEHMQQDVSLPLLSSKTVESTVDRNNELEFTKIISENNEVKSIKMPSLSLLKPKPPPKNRDVELNAVRSNMFAKSALAKYSRVKNDKNILVQSPDSSSMFPVTKPGWFSSTPPLMRGVQRQTDWYRTKLSQLEELCQLDKVNLVVPQLLENNSPLKTDENFHIEVNSPPAVPLVKPVVNIQEYVISSHISLRIQYIAQLKATLSVLSNTLKEMKLLDECELHRKKRLAQRQSEIQQEIEAKQCFHVSNIAKPALLRVMSATQILRKFPIDVKIFFKSVCEDSNYSEYLDVYTPSNFETNIDSIMKLLDSIHHGILKSRRQENISTVEFTHSSTEFQKYLSKVRKLLSSILDHLIPQIQLCTFTIVEAVFLWKVSVGDLHRSYIRKGENFLYTLQSDLDFLAEIYDSNSQLILEGYLPEILSHDLPKFLKNPLLLNSIIGETPSSVISLLKRYNSFCKIPGFDLSADDSNIFFELQNSCKLVYGNVPDIVVPSLKSNISVSYFNLLASHFIIFNEIPYSDIKHGPATWHASFRIVTGVLPESPSYLQETLDSPDLNTKFEKTNILRKPKKGCLKPKLSFDNSASIHVDRKLKLLVSPCDTPLKITSPLSTLSSRVSQKFMEQNQNVEQDAALILQKSWRGFRVRKGVQSELKSLKEEKKIISSVLLCQKMFRSYLQMKLNRENQQLIIMSRAVTVISRAWKSFLSKKNKVLRLKELEENNRLNALKIIQAAFRVHIWSKKAQNGLRLANNIKNSLTLSLHDIPGFHENTNFQSPLRRLVLTGAELVERARGSQDVLNAVIIIQRYCRNRRIQNHKHKQEALKFKKLFWVIIIQANFRGYLSRKKLKKNLKEHILDLTSLLKSAQHKSAVSKNKKGSVQSKFNFDGYNSSQSSKMSSTVIRNSKMYDSRVNLEKFLLVPTREAVEYFNVSKKSLADIPVDSAILFVENLLQKKGEVKRDSSIPINTDSQGNSISVYCVPAPLDSTPIRESSIISRKESRGAMIISGLSVVSPSVTTQTKRSPGYLRTGSIVTTPLPVSPNIDTEKVSNVVKVQFFPRNKSQEEKSESISPVLNEQNAEFSKFESQYESAVILKETPELCNQNTTPNSFTSDGENLLGIERDQRRVAEAALIVENELALSPRNTNHINQESFLSPKNLKDSSPAQESTFSVKNIKKLTNEGLLSPRVNADNSKEPNKNPNDTSGFLSPNSRKPKSAESDITLNLESSHLNDSLNSLIHTVFELKKRLLSLAVPEELISKALLSPHSQAQVSMWS